jgi:hypothetical protein
MAHRRIKVKNLEAWMTARVGPQVRAVTEAVADDARAGCPVDSGDLVSTIRTYYPGKLKGVVIVGGKGPLATDVGYWAPVEFGSAPHWIESHGDYPLRDEHGNIFGRRVWHPGTTPQPFMRPALYRRRKLKAASGATVLSRGAR